MKKNNKGFSLVELIIVIAIMAVLIGLLAPQYLKFVKQSKVSADVSNAQALATAFNVAFADGESLPATNTNTIPAGVSAQIPAPKLDPSATWVISVGDDGVSSITLGGTTVYPVPESPYTK